MNSSDINKLKSLKFRSDSTSNQGDWSPEQCMNLLAPAPEDRNQVQRLCDKLSVSLNADESITFADYNIPVDSAKRTRVQIGILLLAVFCICVARGVPIVVTLPIVLVAAAVGALLLYKSVSGMSLWAITNQRVIKVNGADAVVASWPMSKVRLYGPRIEGGCIAFYMGATTMSRVTIYFPRNPGQVLQALVDQVNNQNMMKGKSTQVLTVQKTPRWQQEAVIAGAVGGLVLSGYFMLVVRPALQLSHADAAAMKQASIQYIFGGFLGCAAVWSCVYALFRREKK